MAKNKFKLTKNLKEIKKLIEDKGVSQIALANSIGVSHIYLNAVLKQRATLTDDLYKRLKFYLERWDT